VFQRRGQLRTAAGGNLVANSVISDPTILFDGGRYRMWFTAARKPYTSSQVVGIAYAESTDGLVWVPRLDSTGEPLLVLNPTPGGWDAGGIETASVVKTPDGKFLLYYSGILAPGANRWAIGMATSNDGITWTKTGNAPVLQGRGGWEGPYTEGGVTVGGTSEPSVLYDPVQKLYKMWYSALGVQSSRMGFRVGYAISSDGRNWSAQPNPVVDVGSAGKWDDTVVSHVNVVYDAASGYHMFYFGTSGSKYEAAEKIKAAMIPGAIGYARSPDGIEWTRQAAPVLSVVPSTWEAWTVGGPSALIQDGQIKLFYFASAASNAYSFRMGLATAAIPNP
jgi:predicted GH43/DUF377 family glycosyl hydrolase